MDPDPSEEQLTIMEIHITESNRSPPESRRRAGLDGAQGLSPMDPPDAYAPPGIEPVPAADLHPFLRKFRDEHVPFLEELNAFEAAILSIQKAGYTREADAKLRHFFQYLDQEFMPHQPARRGETCSPAARAADCER